MQTYIVLLRAVNVSGKNIIKMAELKAHLQKHYNNVQTYIQSGNIILHSDREKHAVHSQIITLIKQYFELDIAVFVLAANELSLIIKNNPFDIDLASNNVYITLLDHKLDEEITRQFDELDLGDEKYRNQGEVLYFYLPKGMANSKLSNPFIEKKLKVIATGRNLNTMHKLLDLIK